MFYVPAKNWFDELKDRWEIKKNYPQFPSKKDISQEINIVEKTSSKQSVQQISDDNQKFPELLPEDYSDISGIRTSQVEFESRKKDCNNISRTVENSLIQNQLALSTGRKEIPVFKEKAATLSVLNTVEKNPSEEEKLIKPEEGTLFESYYNKFFKEGNPLYDRIQKGLRFCIQWENRLEYYSKNKLKICIVFGEEEEDKKIDIESSKNLVSHLNEPKAGILKNRNLENKQQQKLSQVDGDKIQKKQKKKVSFNEEEKNPRTLEKIKVPVFHENGQEFEKITDYFRNTTKQKHFQFSREAKRPLNPKKKERKCFVTVDEMETKLQYARFVQTRLLKGTRRLAVECSSDHPDDDPLNISLIQAIDNVEKNKIPLNEIEKSFGLEDWQYKKYFF